MRLQDFNGVKVNPEHVVALEAILVPAPVPPGLSFDVVRLDVPATRVWLLGERSYIVVRMPIEDVATLLTVTVNP